MHFFLVRDGKTGRITKQVIVNEGNTIPELDDPYWDKVADTRTSLRAQNPNDQVIEGFGDSIEKFLDSWPEYQPVLSPDE